MSPICHVRFDAFDRCFATITWRITQTLFVWEKISAKLMRFQWICHHFSLSLSLSIAHKHVFSVFFHHLIIYVYKCLKRRASVCAGHTMKNDYDVLSHTSHFLPGNNPQLNRLSSSLGSFIVTAMFFFFLFLNLLYLSSRWWWPMFCACLSFNIALCVCVLVYPKNP